MKFTKLLAIFILGTCLLSCEETNHKNRYKPDSLGSQGEIIVVMDNSLWDSEPGLILQNTFERNYPGLLQAEKSFSLVHYKPTNFSKVLKRHPNILLFNNNEKADGIEELKDVWAKNQYVIQVSSINKEELVKILLQRAYEISMLFNKAEIKRLQAYFNRFKN